MKSVLIGLLLSALFAGIHGLVPQRTARVVVPSRLLSAAKMVPFKLDIALPAIFAPFVLPAAVLAAEGTGRAFGIDDSRLIWAAITPALIIFPLYSKWSKDQEGDDFFDGYEKRRNG